MTTHMHDARAPNASAEALSAALRRDLTVALKARQPDAVAALRTAIAAIDNAQAVAVPPDSRPAGRDRVAGARVAGARVAGARHGAGSTEAPRRKLSPDELHGILREQVAECRREADRYQALDQPGAARRLRDQARLVAGYLSPCGAPARCGSSV
jgi:hypothetical protein